METERDPNRGRECEVTIKFLTKDFTKEQMDALFQAQKALHTLGITFDTGYGFKDAVRDWEWDWSLIKNGPIQVVFRRWTDESPEKNRYSEKMKKIREGNMPPEFYAGAQNDNGKDRLDNTESADGLKADLGAASEANGWGAVNGTPQACE